MKPLTVQDVLPPDAYEAARQEFRQRIIELKADRRISVGDLVTRCSKTAGRSCFRFRR